MGTIPSVLGLDAMDEKIRAREQVLNAFLMSVLSAMMVLSCV